MSKSDQDEVYLGQRDKNTTANKLTGDPPSPHLSKTSLQGRRFLLHLQLQLLGLPNKAKKGRSVKRSKTTGTKTTLSRQTHTPKGKTTPGRHQRQHNKTVLEQDVPLEKGRQQTAPRCFVQEGKQGTGGTAPAYDTLLPTHTPHPHPPTPSPLPRPRSIPSTEYRSHCPSHQKMLAIR